MTARTLAVASLLLALLTPASALAVPDGGYLALGVGAGVVSGERGVELESLSGVSLLTSSQAVYDELVRTDIDDGMALELRFGYLIAGLVAPEISLGGHGNFEFEDGAAQATFILRYHPIEHVIPHDARAWDLNLYFGGGYAIAGFHPDRYDDDGKGWEGFNLTFGAGVSYQVGDRISLGADLRFVLPQYGTYIWSRKNDLEFEPSETPDTMFITPTAQVIFHL